jgi:hypothetical protein
MKVTLILTGYKTEYAAGCSDVLFKKSVRNRVYKILQKEVIPTSLKR